MHHKWPTPFIMLRVLADADVNLSILNDRCRNEVASGAFAAKLVFGSLGIAVEFPENLAGLGFEAAKPAVAAGKDDLLDAADFGKGRVGPLTVHDLVAGRVVLPDHFAGFLVQGNETRRIRGREC